MRFITKKSLPRRTFLRGMGTAIALPLLDSMVPALRAGTRAGTPRLGFVYVSNGVIQDQWNPTATGTNFELTPILKPLANVREHVNIISGLSHLQADTFGDGTGDHPRASAAWLTGVHAYDRTQPGVEVKLATSADQIAAKVIGRDTRLASLELNLDYPTQGACDSGDCFYVNTISWRNETTPNPTESNPRIVFQRLFGNGGPPTERAAEAQLRGSVLDSVNREASRLAGTLGPGDRTKLSEYLDAVRDIESRIQKTEGENSESVDLPERPFGIPDTFDAHTKMMFDLLLLAYRSDSTRIFTMVMARELSSRTYPNIGVPEQHHPVSHHRNDPELISKKARIDTYHVQLLSYFLEKMQATKDGEGTLLDNSMILYGGGMGDGNLHRHTDLPCLLAGGSGCRIKTGQHLNYKIDTPMTNLLVTVLDKAGVPIERLGDSTGKLTPDSLSL